MKIIESDMGAIHSKIIEQIKKLWAECRAEIIKERGLDRIREEKEKLTKKREEITQRLMELEEQLSPERLTMHQSIEMGARSSDYNRFKGANFFGIPVENELDYSIVKRIKENVNTEAPAKYLSDLGSSAMREIAMAGTFEDAQKIYEDFYSLDFRKYGVDIPPRLAEMRDAKEKGQEFMLGYTDKPQLPEKTKKKNKKKVKE